MTEFLFFGWTIHSTWHTNPIWLFKSNH